MSTPIFEDELAIVPRSAERPQTIHVPLGASLAILTDAETRAAEQRLFDQGVTAGTLMDRAGKTIADIIATRFPKEDVLVACGPGNNGGDGYVIAAALRARGFAVRVAALGEPKSEAAKAARAKWGGPIEPIEGTPRPARLLVDAVFGSGQTRPIDPALERWLLNAGSWRRVAVDLPTGVCGDTGRLLGEPGWGLVTIAIGCFKPAHLLLPAAARNEQLVLAPIGLPVDPYDHPLQMLEPRELEGPKATANKYSRGKVVVIGGTMAGAAHLAAIAAQRSGAGYVELVLDDAPVAPPYSLVRRNWSDEVLRDRRIGAIAIGPGLVSGHEGMARLEAVLAVDRPAVLDAGALALLGELGLDALGRAPAVRVLTPHDGEFERLFGPIGADRIAAVRAAAARSEAIVLLKGAATIVAAPDGGARIAPLASPWLATAGTGDVLTGIVATMLAQREAHGFDPLEAVAQAVRIHNRAADLAGPAMIADDLLNHLPRVVTEL